MKDTDPSASSTRQNPSPVPAPSDGGNASERPNAGQQPGSWYATAMREHDRANAAELDRNAAAQRASSWWETSKTLNRAWKGANAMRASDAWLNRETRRQCDQVQLHLGPLYNDDHHSWSVEKLAEKAAADIASGTKRDTTVDSGTMGAMARIIIQAGEERAERGIIASGYRERVAERDADRAKLDEHVSDWARLKQVLGIGASDPLPSNEEAIKAAAALYIERDADRAKLDEMRAAVAKFEATDIAWPLMQEIPVVSDLIGSLGDLLAVERTTTEPANVEPKHGWNCSMIGDQCMSMHCPDCGEPTGPQGHLNCPLRATTEDGR